MRTLLIAQSTQPLLDEQRDLASAVEAVLFAAPVRLEELSHRSPGAYVLLYVGDVECYQRLRRPGGRNDRRPIASAGGAPIYIGSARDLGERRNRHVANLAGCVDISPADLLIIALPTATKAGGVYLETALIDSVFHPIWNTPVLSGFGSRRQGRSREQHQRVSTWNLLHPGRHVHAKAPRPDIDLNDLRTKVRHHIAATVTDPFTISTPAGWV